MKTNKGLKTKVIKAFCIGALLWVCLYAGQANGQIPSNREIISTLLENDNAYYKNDVIDILFNADTITYSDVIEAEDGDCQDSILDLYWKSSNIRTLSEDDKRELFSLFLHNTHCYERGMIGISAPYIPVLQITLSHEGKQITIMFSKSDKTWKILYNGITIFRNRFECNHKTNRFIDHLLE